MGAMIINKTSVSVSVSVSSKCSRERRTSRGSRLQALQSKYQLDKAGKSHCQSAQSELNMFQQGISDSPMTQPLILWTFK